MPFSATARSVAEVPSAGRPAAGTSGSTTTSAARPGKLIWRISKYQYGSGEPLVNSRALRHDCYQSLFICLIPIFILLFHPWRQKLLTFFYLCGTFLTIPHRDNYSVHLSPGGKLLNCSTKNDKNVRVLHQV